jgi:hypothetical protein
MHDIRLIHVPGKRKMVARVLTCTLFFESAVHHKEMHLLLFLLLRLLVLFCGGFPRQLAIQRTAMDREDQSADLIYSHHVRRG